MSANALDALMQGLNRRRIALLQRQATLGPAERGELVALQRLVEAWLDLRWPLPRVPDAAADAGEGEG